MRHNRLLLILLALNIGFSATLFQNVAYAQNIDSQSESSYFKNKWPGRAGMSEEVQAYALPNAGYIDVTGFKPEYFGLPKGSSGYAFLTRHFFERSGISTDSDYTDLPVLTYRYYQPKATQPADRLNRGGGRDVILMPTQDTEKLKGAIYTIKGSGTNSRYSEANGAFDITDFRKNGLQTLSEALLEHIVMRQFEHNAQYGKYSSNSPVKGSKGIIILPIEAQKKIHGNNLEVGKLAAQTIRDQRVPRDSFYTVDNYEPQIPYEQKIKVSAYMFLWNIGHGAINLENMSQGINDPGHVTTGYPGLSSNYRCVLCNGFAGSRYDGTMVGILDYYFPTKSTNWPSARNNHIFSNDEKSKQITRDLVQEVFRALTGRRSINLQLTDEEATAFADILNEKIDEQSSKFQSKIASIGTVLLNLDNNLPTEIFAGVNRQYSLRFILQMAAMRYLAPSHVRGFLNHANQFLFKDNKSALLIMQALHRIVSENNITTAELKGLMEEHLPVNVLQTKLDNELKVLQRRYDQTLEMPQLQRDVNSLVKKYSGPTPLAIDKYVTYLKNNLSDNLSDAKIDRLFRDALKKGDERSLELAIEALLSKTPYNVQKIDEWIVALNNNSDLNLKPSVELLVNKRIETFEYLINAHLSETTLNALLNLIMQTENTNILMSLFSYAKPVVKRRFQIKILNALGSDELPLNHRLTLLLGAVYLDTAHTVEKIQILLRSSLKKRDKDSLIEIMRLAGDFISNNSSNFEFKLLRDILYFGMEEKSEKLIHRRLLRAVGLHNLYLKPALFISTLYAPFSDADTRLGDVAYDALMGKVPKNIVNHLFKKDVARFYQAIGLKLNSLLENSDRYYSLDPYLDVIIQAIWKGSARDTYLYTVLTRNNKLMRRFNLKFSFFVESLLMTIKESRFSELEAKVLFRTLIEQKALSPKNEAVVKRLEQAESLEQMLEIAGLNTAVTCAQPFSN